jgi:uncharacterized membrane protein YgaE (UPF0421/DUF939 family)
MMNMFESIRISLQITLVSLVSYLVGFYTTSFIHELSAGLGGLWAAISGIVVLQATQKDTWSLAWIRVLGTAIGAVVSAVYLMMLPFSPVGMAAAIFITMLICHAVGIPSHARLAALTVVLIMVTSNMHPGLDPVLNAALRFSESCIGTTIAVLIVLIFPGQKEETK